MMSTERLDGESRSSHVLLTDEVTVRLGSGSQAGARGCWAHQCFYERGTLLSRKRQCFVATNSLLRGASHAAPDKVRDGLLFEACRALQYLLVFSTDPCFETFPQERSPAGVIFVGRCVFHA